MEREQSSATLDLLRAPLPSVDSLRCFLAGARGPSFRAAAHVVALTPQAFSQRIKLLEEQLGVRLFERTTRSVQLTPAGLSLRSLAETALQSTLACARVGDGRGEPSQTSLVLGTRHELGLSWIEPSLDELRRMLPWLELHLYFGSGPDILHRVASGQVDCAVSSARLTDSALIGLPLHHEAYAFVASAGRLRRHPFKKPEQALLHPILDVDETLPLFRYWRDARPEHSAMRFASIRRYGTSEAVRRRTLAGEGVAVLPCYLIEGDLRRGRLVRLFPRSPLLDDHFRLVVRAQDAKRPLYDQLAAALRKLPLR